MTRRRQLQDLIQMEKNRLEHAPFPRLRVSLQTTIGFLKEQLAALDGEIDDFCRQNPLWVEQNRIITGVIGVGPNTSWALAAFLPELGRLNRQEATSLGGLPPSTVTAAHGEGPAISRGAAARGARPSTWPPCRILVITR